MTSELAVLRCVVIQLRIRVRIRVKCIQILWFCVLCYACVCKHKHTHTYTHTLLIHEYYMQWVGMSIMTICEWFEFLFFAVLSMPVFFCGIRNMPHVVQDEVCVQPSLYVPRAYVRLVCTYIHVCRPMHSYANICTHYAHDSCSSPGSRWGAYMCLCLRLHFMQICLFGQYSRRAPTTGFSRVWPGVRTCIPTTLRQARTHKGT